MTLATLSDVLLPALSQGYAVAGMVTLGWEDMRAFAVRWKGDSIEMTSQSGKQTWVISPNGMLYTDRAWGPQKVFAQRRWKRISG